MSVSEPYSVEQLKEGIGTGWTPNYLFFWGHTPNRNGALGAECLSQWYPASFVVDGDRYETAEHYMMCEKARLFGDDEAAKRILAVKHPSEAKGLGRSVQRFDEDTWKARRFEIVVAGSCAKFSQNDALAKFLLATKPRVLVEASPRDTIWGIGLGQNNPDARSPERWRGLNLLGFALMKARATLASPG